MQLTCPPRFPRNRKTAMTLICEARVMRKRWAGSDVTHPLISAHKLLVSGSRYTVQRHLSALLGLQTIHPHWHVTVFNYSFNRSRH